VTRLTLEPLTRVEGHGRIELALNHGRLQSVQVDLNESPRFFEAMLVGRDWREVPELVCRICGICSAVHKLAALSAVEQAAGIRVPPAAAVVRELLLLGGHIQSHALHLFCLVLPDFYAASSVLELVRERNPLALAGLELKQLGNRLQELFGGRVVHPVNAVPGGIRWRPPRELLLPLLEEIEMWRERWRSLSADWLASGRYPVGQQVVGNYLATGNRSGFALSGDYLWLASGEVLPVSQYRRVLSERAVVGSHAKQAAGSSGPFLVGALARLGLARMRGIEAGTVPDQPQIYDNNAAQAWETGWALSRAGQLVAELLDTAADAPIEAMQPQSRAGTGIAAYEAPRGLLIHEYVLDELGRVVDANVVTPTSINQRAIAAQLHRDLAEVTAESLLAEIAEQIVRAFDPCISCAVHILEGSSKR